MTKRISTHHDLTVWQESMQLVSETYALTKKLPREEMFGLTTQMRRSAVSVPSNIAEGAARQTKKEFVQLLHISKGSLSELDTQLEIARRLEYLGKIEWEALNNLLERVDKMLSGLIRHLRVTR